MKICVKMNLRKTSAWKHFDHKISMYTWDQKIMILEIIWFSKKQGGKKFFNSFGTVYWKRKKITEFEVLISHHWVKTCIYLTYKEADFLCSIPLFPVGHAKQHQVSEQHPPLMQKEACAVFFYLSLQDRTEVGSLSFLSQALIYIWFLISCLTFICTEESPCGEV